MRRLLLALGIVLLAMPASSALARGRPKYLAPPGNSAVSEYLEVVPTADGPAAPRGPAPPHSGATPPGPLPPAEQRKLVALGADGRTLANVVAATTPPTSATSSVSGSTSGSERGSNEPAAPSADHGLAALSTGAGSSAVSAVLAAATGHEVGGGLGILLPLLIFGALTAALGAALWRRRVSRS